MSAESHVDDATAIDVDLGCLGPVDWPSRLEHEMPLLRDVLEAAPSRRVIDLGCGTGEHVRHLASLGYEALGIDGSETRLAAAEAGVGEEHGDRADFALGDIGAVEAGVRGHFGAALCLGNTLAQMIGTETVARMIVGLRRRLLVGAPLVIHLWNFERIFGRRERDRPLTHRFDEDGRQQVWMGLLAPRTDGMVAMTTSILGADASNDPPLEVLASRTTFLQGWTRRDIDTLLDVGRFRKRQYYGGFDRSPFHPIESTDLVVVAQ